MLERLFSLKIFIKVDENKDDWDIFWCDMTQLRDLFQTGKLLDDHQKIGHFRNCQELSRKNQLVKNLKKLRFICYPLYL